MQVCDALHTDINYFMIFILADGIGEKQKCWNREKMGKEANVWKNRANTKWEHISHWVILELAIKHFIINSN